MSTLARDRKIFRLMKEGATEKELSSRFNLYPATIYGICRKMKKRDEMSRKFGSLYGSDLRDSTIARIKKATSNSNPSLLDLQKFIEGDPKWSSKLGRNFPSWMRLEIMQFAIENGIRVGDIPPSLAVPQHSEKIGGEFAHLCDSDLSGGARKAVEQASSNPHPTLIDLQRFIEEDPVWASKLLECSDMSTLKEVREIAEANGIRVTFLLSFVGLNKKTISQIKKALSQSEVPTLRHLQRFIEEDPVWASKLLECSDMSTLKEIKEIAEANGIIVNEKDLPLSFVGLTKGAIRQIKKALSKSEEPTFRDLQHFIEGRPSWQPWFVFFDCHKSTLLKIKDFAVRHGIKVNQEQFAAYFRPLPKKKRRECRRLFNKILKVGVLVPVTETLRASCKARMEEIKLNKGVSQENLFKFFLRMYQICSGPREIIWTAERVGMVTLIDKGTVPVDPFFF